MAKKFGLIALAVLASGFACAPHSNAGTDMVIDNSAQAPPPAPLPPPPVYYPPPPAVAVAVFPARRFFVAPVRVIAFRRVHRRVIFVR